MKTLIFTAHPSQEGFIHKIANQYAGTKKTQGVKTEIINLYDEKWKMPFLTFENISEKDEPEVKKLLQEKIRESDELVFVFPLWWSEAPAIVKNAIDTLFSSGFAFQFEEGKLQPKKLLEGKCAKIFVTCDAPKLYYWFKGYPFKTTWKDFILGFCGIKLENFEVFDKMREKSEKEKKNLLEKVTKIALD